MALQGTLDTFALPDVLRLLAATTKSGRLRVSGDRASGAVWFAEGRLRGGELADGAGHDLDEVLLHLLRNTEGSFGFDGLTPPEPVDGAGDVTVDDALAEVEELLEEWRIIEAAVPSPESWLSLVATLGELDGTPAEVVLTAAEWRIAVAVGSDASVDELLEHLDGDELSSLRVVAALVERGLVLVGAPQPEALRMPASLRADSAAPSLGSPVVAGRETTSTAPGDASPAVVAAAAHDDLPSIPTSVMEAPADATPVGHAADAIGASWHADDAAGAVDEIVARPSHHELSGLGTVGLSVEREPRSSVDVAPPLSFAPVPEVPPSLPAPDGREAHGSYADEEQAVADVAPSSPDEAAEIARQLASLSPRAAKAVAAAAKAETPEEREAALAAIEAEDDTVNRGLLLKFLGSVDS